MPTAPSPRLPDPGWFVLAAGLLCGLPAAVPSNAGQVPCPTSYVEFDAHFETPPVIPVDGVAYDTTFVTSEWETAHVAFDRSLAMLELDAQSIGRTNVGVRVVETLDVTGVPPGTEVQGLVQLSLDGWSEQFCGGSGCGVRLEGWLVSAQDSTAANANQFGPSYGRRDLAAVITVPVTFAAGAPIEAQFYLRFGTGPGGGATAEVTGHYAVVGLPAGVGYVSCIGSVTPVVTGSWGTLKVRYR